MFIKLPKYLCFVEEEGSEGTGGGEGSESSSKEDSTLTSAIDKAAAEVEKGLKTDEDDQKDDEDSENSGDDKKDDEAESDDEEEDEDEEEPDEETKKEGVKLLKLLNDPKTSKAVIEYLAKQAGLSFKEAETKEEKKDVIKGIKEIIDEEFGEKYPFMADKLTSALEKILKVKMEESTKDIREKLATAEKKVLLQEIKDGQKEVIESYVAVSPKIIQEVARIQTEGELVPGKNMSHAKYFRLCVEMAAENLGKTLVKKVVKIEDTKKKDSPLDRLGGQRSHKEGVKVVRAKTLDEAINATAERIASEMKVG